MGSEANIGFHHAGDSSKLNFKLYFPTSPPYDKVQKYGFRVLHSVTCQFELFDKKKIDKERVRMHPTSVQDLDPSYHYFS